MADNETPLERAYRLGEGLGGLDAEGVRRLVEISRENEEKRDLDLDQLPDPEASWSLRNTTR